MILLVWAVSAMETLTWSTAKKASIFVRLANRGTLARRCSQIKTKLGSLVCWVSCGALFGNRAAELCTAIVPGHGKLQQVELRKERIR